ncbi:MAG: sulfotransferase [Nitrosomonas sp.]|nr:sulfotransferase [Nitrosomonas sp.]MDP1951501.1 sulfotransferase [Nitrosomonas sp.]
MNEKSNLIFLLGAGRSGTTLLYKILSAHRNVAYLSNYQQRYPEWPFLACLQRLPNYFPGLKRKSWFKESGGAYFNERRRLWLHSIVPTPSEAESVYASCGIPLAPAEDYYLLPHTADCLRERFERILHASGADVLLSKRTANNRRIPVLKQIFPNAKYIHLIRDGRAVAHSLLQVKWWNDHTLYWAGKTLRQMIAEGADPIELAAQNWVEEMHSLERGIALIQSNQLLEVRYDELLRDPCGQLQRILDFMEATVQADATFWGIVESLHFAPRQEAWVRNWTESELNRVLNLQGDTLHRWGFLATDE